MAERGSSRAIGWDGFRSGTNHNATSAMVHWVKLPIVLIASVRNSSRSQIAEALIREHLGSQLRVLSAGSNPTGLDPDVVQTLGRVDLDVGEQCAKGFDSVSGNIDLMVFLGPRPSDASVAGLRWDRELHWPIDDPTVVRIQPKAFLTAPRLRQHEFRKARLEITAMLDLVASAVGLPIDSTIRPAVGSDLALVNGLLDEANLPLCSTDFPKGVVVSCTAGCVVGAALLERRGGFGVLRSVVAEQHRGRHFGRVLVTNRLCEARSEAHDSVYVLDETASGIFGTFGFVAIDRDRVPSVVSDSEQTKPAQHDTALHLQIADRSRTEAALDRDVAAAIAEARTLPPPWDKFPDIPRRKLHWRMGSGEWYLWMWARWWATLEKSQRQTYRATWQSTAPLDWSDWLAPPAEQSDQF